MADETTTTPTPDASGVSTAVDAPETPETSPTPVAAPAPDPIQELRRELAQQRADTETALRTLVGIITQQTAAAGEPAPDPDQVKAKLREQLDQDPEAAIEAIVSKRLGPVLREGAERTGALAREEARRWAEANDWGQDWAETAGDIDRWVANIPVDLLTKPETWKSAFQLVLAEKDELGKRHLAREQRRMHREQQMASEASSSGRIDPKRPSPLTEQEKRIAKAAGISEDAYRRNRDALRQERESRWEGR